MRRMKLDVLGRKLINGVFEALEWRTGRAKLHAGKAGSLSKGGFVRAGSHSSVPQGFAQNGPFPRQEIMKYRHIPALSFLALSHFGSNLDVAVYEFTAWRALTVSPRRHA
ncbi:hypothetical protein [Novosphingobium sp.]|uniref:hypothetical protein n=1 Tax=Novosphingobium sp. TaxID=1874826 RepID=UPI002732EA1C|nr:hypothetical protein [Novosphingobium sp.]